MEKLEISKGLYEFYISEKEKLSENLSENDLILYMFQKWEFPESQNEEFDKLNIKELMQLLTGHFEVIQTKEELLSKEYKKNISKFHMVNDEKTEIYISGKLDGIKIALSCLNIKIKGINCD